MSFSRGSSQSIPQTHLDRLTQHYGGKRCIITRRAGVSVEWARIVEFDDPGPQQLEHMFQRQLLDPSTLPARLTEGSYNIVSLDQSLHTELDNACWTVFPTQTDLKNFIDHEERHIIYRLSEIQQGNQDPGRPPFYFTAPSYRYEVHFGPLAVPMVAIYPTRLGQSPTIYTSATDIRPGLASSQPFPTLDLLCTPPCVLYGCLTRFIAATTFGIMPTVHQVNICRLATYLMHLFEWDPTSMCDQTLLHARPSALLSRTVRLERTLRAHLSSENHRPQASGSSTQATSASRSTRSTRSSGQLQIQDGSPDTSWNSEAKHEIYEQKASDDESLQRVAKWTESVSFGGDEAWSAGASWPAEPPPACGGKSANDQMFLAGYLPAWALMRYQVEGRH